MRAIRCADAELNLASCPYQHYLRKRRFGAEDFVVIDRKMRKLKPETRVRLYRINYRTLIMN